MDITLSNLTISYPGKEIYKDFNLVLHENEITCILGFSGVGKTTLLNAIAGTINYEGTINKPNNDISFIYQNDRLIPNISVYKNLELVLFNKIKDKNKRKDLINNVLKLVELENEGNSFPKALSGGMQSRVSLARGFIYPSKILLMDECFKGLDPALKKRLINAFIKLYNANPKTTLLVTHQIDEALLLADRIIVINGSPCSIIKDIKINMIHENRTLIDPYLDGIRHELLETLEN